MNIHFLVLEIFLSTIELDFRVSLEFCLILTCIPSLR